MKEILISSGVLIPVIILLRQLFRSKVSQRLVYGAWLLVALRLLIPVQLGQSEYSVTSLTEKIENQSQPIQQVQAALQEPVAGPSRAELYEQLLNDYVQQSTAPATPEIREQIEIQVEKQVTAPTLSEILTAAWIGGMGIMAIWLLSTNILFLRRAKKGAVPFTECNTPVPVRISPNVPTPCLVGLFRPVIYLTTASTESPQSLNHVLTHELSHLRHWDHIWSLVRCVCLCIYWFDPLVWVAAILSKRDCELACDEGALKKLGDVERIPYGKTLLHIVTHSNSPAHLLETATAMNETKKQLKERVNFIVKKPRNLLIAAISLILIAALTAGCAFMGSKPTNSPNLPSTEPSAPDISPYRDILDGYDTLINAQLTDTFNPDLTPEALIQAMQGDARLERKWSNMLMDMTAGLLSPTENSFHHLTRDINGDEVPELFWIREDGTLLAVFTICEGQGILLDAYWPQYKAVMTDEGKLYSLFYSGAGYDDYEILTLSTEGKLTTEQAFGADSLGSYYYEVVDGAETSITAARFNEIMAANPFQWGQSWAVLLPNVIPNDPINPPETTDPPESTAPTELSKPNYIQNAPDTALYGKWTAHVYIRDGATLSYSLQFNEDGTVVYTMGYYGSELIEKMEGSWKPANESYGSDAYYLELTPVVLEENTAALTYVYQGVYRFRCAEDGSVIHAQLKDGLPMFSFYSDVDLVLYRLDSDGYYDIPIQSVN